MRKFLIGIVLSALITTLAGCDMSRGIDVDEFTQSNQPAQSEGEAFVDETLGSYGLPIINPIIDFSTMGAEYQAILDMPADVDLLDLSDIVAFSQVYNMMTEFEQFQGDVVRVNGNYYRHTIEEIDHSYHFLLLVDGTNCCTGILEFMVEDGVEYPESGENLLLIGEYSKYTDEYGTYPYIIVSDFLTY